MSKKTVLITGCSPGGIGEELAKQYHSRGHLVIATGRTAASLEVLEKLGMRTLLLDVTDSQTIDAAKEQVKEITGGKLNILINNAGVAHPYTALDVNIDDVRRVFEVNLFGQMLMVQCFADLLIASEDGCIVHMGSIAGVMPMPFSVAYNTSKAALHSFGDTLRVELAPFNIKVITMIGGNIRTNITKPWHRIPANSLYEPLSEIYKAKRIDNFHDGAQSPESVAKAILKETLKSKPRAWLWLGKNSWLVWFISTFLSKKAFDPILSKMFGLAQLSYLRQQEKKRL